MNIVKECLFNGIKFILTVIAILTVLVGVIVVFNITNNIINYKSEYVLRSLSFAGEVSMIIVLIILVTYFSSFFSKIFKKKQEKEDTHSNNKLMYNIVDEDKISIKSPKRVNIFLKGEGIFKENKVIINSLVAIVVIGLLFIGYTNYNLIKEDSIILKRTFYTKEFSYRDVDKITTGITTVKGNNFYYNLVMNDGSSIRLITGIVDTKENNYEDAIYSIDKKLLSMGANKEIDRSNIYKFLRQNYNSDYETSVLKLLK